MESRDVFALLSLTLLLCTRSASEPAPERFSLPLAGKVDPSSQSQDSSSSDSQMWQHTLFNSSDSKKATFLDPLTSADAEELLKNDFRRNLYNPPLYNMGQQQYPYPAYQPAPNTGFQRSPNMGAQPLPNPGYQQFPSSSSYPQIYKLDNLIIIANPPSSQPQPCIPQGLHPSDFPTPNISNNEDSIPNRMGEDDEKNDYEPSKCTWAVVACCSPDSGKVRYNCFELLGCPGFFFDGSPCEPKVVEAAAESTLNYYRSANRGKSSRNKI